MRPRPPQMVQDVRVGAAGLLKGIAQHRQPDLVERALGHVSLVVGGLGEADHGGVVPGQDGGVEDGGAGIAYSGLRSISGLSSSSIR